MFLTLPELLEIQRLIEALEGIRGELSFEVQITDVNGDPAGAVSFDPTFPQYVWRLVG